MKQRSILIFFTLLALIMLIVGGTAPFVIVQGKLQTILLPFMKITYQGATRSESLLSTVQQIKDLSTENNSLKKENQELKAKVVQFGELDYKISVLEKELKIQNGNSQNKFIAAAVVGRTPSTFREIITIDKGSLDGIT